MIIVLLRRFCLVITLATSLANISLAQAMVRGDVLDGSVPMPYVTVQLQGTTMATITDSLGRFALVDVPPGQHVLVASALGFSFKQKKIDLKAGQEIEVSFLAREDGLALNQVVVSATLKPTSKLDSPIAVEVYSDQFFRANPTPSVFEALQTINGVRPQLNCNICNTGDIHINGLEGPYTMVLIDGMPIVSGLATVYGLTGIPQSLIERIEVVKGPASTLYGSEAVGGLINVITKKVENAPRLSADLFTTDWGEVNADLGLRFGFGGGANSLLGVNYFNYTQPIDNNGDGFTDVTLQNRFSIFNKWAFQRKSGKLLSMAGRYVYENRWGGQLGWTNGDRGSDRVYGESILTNRWEALGTYQLPTSEDIFFSFSANGHDQNSYYGDVLYDARQYVAFGQLSWNRGLGKKHDLVMGLAYRQTWYDDSTPATASAEGSANKPSVIRLPGAFVQDEWSLNRRHKLLLGLRYDYNDNHGSILSPRLNYQYNSPDRETTLRLGLGNGFRVANVFTEDHAALTGAREVVFAGALNPETSYNANVNLMRQFFFPDGTFLSLDASAFYTYFTNRIVPDYETDPNRIIYDNLDGHAVSRGLSFNAELELPSSVNLSAGATLQDVSLTEEGVSRRQLLTESWSGVWTATYTIQSWKLKVDYTGNIFGPMRLPLLSDLDDRPEYSPVWSIQNLQLTRSFGSRFELYGGIKNLLNYTPPANSIARPFDPFDRGVSFGANGEVIPTPENPRALTFDPTYVFAPNQGRRFFLGARYRVD